MWTQSALMDLNENTLLRCICAPPGDRDSPMVAGCSRKRVFLYLKFDIRYNYAYFFLSTLSIFHYEIMMYNLPSPRNTLNPFDFMNELNDAGSFHSSIIRGHSRNKCNTYFTLITLAIGDCVRVRVSWPIRKVLLSSSFSLIGQETQTRTQSPIANVIQVLRTIPMRFLTLLLASTKI